MHGGRRLGRGGPVAVEDRNRVVVTAMATSIAVLSSWALVPKASSMLATDTPAAAAIERIVVAGSPALANCSAAAATMR